MPDHSLALLKANLKQLRLPTVLAEFEQLAREALDSGQSYTHYLLRLTELEVAARTANALAARIKQAGFPTGKSLETFDLTATPRVRKQQVLDIVGGCCVTTH